MTTNQITITSPNKLSLKQQRLALREQLASQRIIIEFKLGPVATERALQYPRSKTMRFLTQRPELMKKLLGLVIGASFVKSMHPLLTIVKFLHSSANSRW